MAEIAKTKVARKGTEIHAEIGMKKDAREKKVVHTCTKTHMIQAKGIAGKKSDSRRKSRYRSASKRDCRESRLP